jgi:hypothetical protein
MGFGLSKYEKTFIFQYFFSNKKFEKSRV